MTNILSKNDTEIITEVKSFMYRGQCYKTFLAVIYATSGVFPCDFG
jgi:hypothetical protein